MKLNRETVYDLENQYDVIADKDEDLIDKKFTALQALHGEVTRKNNYGRDEIDDKLVSLFVQAAKEKNISEDWAKAYLFYVYFDEE
jgi:hypothetical protein